MGKRCPNCQMTKPLGDFAVNNKLKDGRQTYCRVCKSAMYQARREARLARAAVRYRTKEQELRAYGRRYYQKHKVRDRVANAARARLWCEANPERVAAIQSRSKRKHSARVRATNAQRRAKKAGAFSGNRAAYTRFVAWSKRSGTIPCYWCGKKTTPRTRHLDHVIPLSKHGSDSVGNLCISCPTCNTRKGSKMPEVFSGQSEILLR